MIYEANVTSYCKCSRASLWLAKIPAISVVFISGKTDNCWNGCGVDNSMGTEEIDDRGRVTIPKELREKTGLRAKARVRITAEKNVVKIEKAIDLNDFITELKGCITMKGDIDPLRLKEIWRTAP